MFHPQSSRRGNKCLAFLCAAAMSLTLAQTAFSQGEFDFTDEGETTGEDSFDFVDTPQEPLRLDEDFVMPNNGKPVNLVFFEPVDATPERTLDSLTKAMVESLQDSRYAEYDSVKALPILQKLSTMSADDRANCVNEPACLAEMGREIGAANIVMGRIYTENREKPQVTLDLIEVATANNKNSIYFDTQARLRKQEQDISGALLRLFNIDTGSLDSLLGTAVVEESAPLPTGQLVSGIVVGVVGLAAIGTGVYFGLEAKKHEGLVKKAIEDNKAKTDRRAEGIYGQGIDNQVTAKKNLDKAKNNAMIANILYASGAVASVVSVILFLVRSEEEDIFAEQDFQISPSFSSDGAGIAAGFRF